MKKNSRDILILQDNASKVPINNRTSCVYRIVCFSTGKCYIGQTVNVQERKNDHFTMLKNGEHHSPRLQHAYKTYGRQSFYFEILEEGIQHTLGYQREIWWIAHFNSFNNGYNMTAGGTGESKPAKRCIWKDVEYPSLESLSKAIGISVAAINKGYIKVTMIDDDAEDRDIKPIPGNGNPLVWEGVQYRSIAEAARAIGITSSSLHRSIKRARARGELA